MMVDGDGKNFISASLVVGNCCNLWFLSGGFFESACGIAGGWVGWIRALEMGVGVGWVVVVGFMYE